MCNLSSIIDVPSLFLVVCCNICYVSDVYVLEYLMFAWCMIMYRYVLVLLFIIIYAYLWILCIFMWSYVVVRSIVYYDVLSIIVIILLLRTILYYSWLFVIISYCITYIFCLLLFLLIIYSHYSLIHRYLWLFFLYCSSCGICYVSRIFCHLLIYLNLSATSHDKNLSNSGVAPNCCKLQLV